MGGVYVERSFLVEGLVVTPSINYYSLFRIRRRIGLVGRGSSCLRVSVGSNICIPDCKVNPSCLSCLGGRIRGLGPVSTRLVMGRPRRCLRAFTGTKTTCVAPRASYVRNSTFMAVRGVGRLNYGTNITLDPSIPLSAVRCCLPLLSGIAVVVISPNVTNRPISPRVFMGVGRLTGVEGRENLGFLVRTSNSVGDDLCHPLCGTNTSLMVLKPPTL